MARTLYIGVFGLLGVFARYGVNGIAPKYFGMNFPYATFFINLVGSFLIGIVYVVGVERSVISEDLRIGLMVGLLGGFTTFSSYCLETTILLEKSKPAAAAFYFFGSPVLGLLGSFSGVFLTRALLRGLA